MCVKLTEVKRFKPEKPKMTKTDLKPITSVFKNKDFKHQYRNVMTIFIYLKCK